MKLQDYFPYDAVILGLLQVYHGVGHDSFFINQPCILVKEHIVTTGETYFLFEYSDGKLIKSSMIKLIDTFYFNERVYLLTDLISGEIMLRNHILKNVKERCQWKLFDIDTFRDILFAKEEQYYGKRTYNYTDDELLELEDE